MKGGKMEVTERIKDRTGRLGVGQYCNARETLKKYFKDLNHVGTEEQVIVRMCDFKKLF